jgi:hypothetical protein
MVEAMKPLVLSMLILLPVARASAESDLALKFPEAKASLPFIHSFPTLAKLLTLDDPWKLHPGELAAKLFPADVKLVQGSAAYPLLFDGQRSTNWPGLPVWNQVAYETEYYVFDPARPVIRFHTVGRWMAEFNTRTIRCPMKRKRCSRRWRNRCGKKSLTTFANSLRC